MFTVYLVTDYKIELLENLKFCIGIFNKTISALCKIKSFVTLIAPDSWIFHTMKHFGLSSLWIGQWLLLSNLVSPGTIFRSVALLGRFNFLLLSSAELTDGRPGCFRATFALVRRAVVISIVHSTNAFCLSFLGFVDWTSSKSLRYCSHGFIIIIIIIIIIITDFLLTT